MNVYVVEEHERYEGGAVLGVFTSIRRAKKLYHETDAPTRSDMVTIVEYPTNGGPGSLILSKVGS